MYFYYGITHSSLENAQEEIELTVDQSFLTPNPQQKSNNNHHNQTPTAVWDRHGYENRMAEDSWSTAGGGNNYNTSNWDTIDTSRGWDDPAPNISSSKPTIPSKPTTTASSSSTSTKSRPPPQAKPKIAPKATPKATPQPKPQPSEPPKGGFTSIFVEETHFPSWED